MKVSISQYAQKRVQKNYLSVAHSSVCPAPFLGTNFCFCIRIVRGLFAGLAQALMESVCEVILISMRIPSTALLPLTFLTLLDCFGLIRLHWFPHMPLHARTHMIAHIYVHTHLFPFMQELAYSLHSSLGIQTARQTSAVCTKAIVVALLFFGESVWVCQLCSIRDRILVILQ